MAAAQKEHDRSSECADAQALDRLVDVVLYDRILDLRREGLKRRHVVLNIKVQLRELEQFADLFVAGIGQRPEQPRSVGADAVTNEPVG